MLERLPTLCPRPSDTKRQVVKQEPGDAGKSLPRQTTTEKVSYTR